MKSPRPDDIEEYFKAREEAEKTRKRSGSGEGGKRIEGLPRKISDSIWIKVGKGPYIQYKKNPNSDDKPKFISLGK